MAKMVTLPVQIYSNTQCLRRIVKTSWIPVADDEDCSDPCQNLRNSCKEHWGSGWPVVHGGALLQLGIVGGNGTKINFLHIGDGCPTLVLLELQKYLTLPRT